jgi:hypothetical protein
LVVHRQVDDPKGDWSMIVDSERWMNIRRFRALHVAGASYAEISRECGCGPWTVRQYLAEDAGSAPPTAPSRLCTQPRLIAPFIHRVRGVLAARRRVVEGQRDS